LMPLGDEAFAFALERWEIWRRYETAFHKGEVGAEHHPVLPAERDRYNELERMLVGKLRVVPERAIRKQAEFRWREDPEWSGYGISPLEVRWIEPKA